MNKYTTLAYPFFYLVLCFSLALPLTANAQITNPAADSPQQISIAQGVPDLDSVFVHNYVKSEKEFSAHLPLVNSFYGNRNFAFAWFRDGKLIPLADKLMDAIQNAKKEGLNPTDYQAKNLMQQFRQFEGLSELDPRKKNLKQELEVALTASYFNYASDFYKGTLDPHHLDAVEWQVRRNKIKLDRVLESILQGKDNPSPYYEFEALHEGYKKLSQALVHYRQWQQQGGWARIAPDTMVELHDTATVVLALRKRLLPSQTLNPFDSAHYVFDLGLENAVKDFQMRHGLTPDGIAGPNTYAALNVPVDERIDQLLLNMERWRWLPKNLAGDNPEERYVMVNIPGYQLRVMEKGQEAMQMKVVVGKTMNATPIFSHQIQYLMFSPYWNVPNSIVEEDIKPHLQTDRGWLNRMNMEMVTTFGPSARRVPLSRVNWYTMTQYNFKYRIRQKPGPTNSLGEVKFMFPNEYAVYLHDTPADHLFSQAERDFSHGCVRVERPADLATYLLQDKSGWDKDRVIKAMKRRDELRIDLPQNVPVYLVYFTAWVDEAGAVQFRDDLYGHDKVLAQKFF